MATKFYLHDATTSNTGTLPTGKHSATTDAQTGTPTGKNTQKSMSATIGTAQTSASWSTLAVTTAQPTLLRMFESGPLQGQVIGAGTWQLSMAAIEANANANLHLCACVYVWRPSTGAIVGTRIFDSPSTNTGNVAEPGVTETAVTDTSISGGSVTCLDNDILVCEIWRDATVQGTATARACQFFYDGTTEASAASNAAFLLAPADIGLISELPPAGSVTFDAASHGDIGTSGNSLTFSHTPVHTDGTTAVVGVTTCTNTGTDKPVTGITYDGNAMTQIKQVDEQAGGNIELWGILGQSGSGAKSIVISTSGTPDEIHAIAMTARNGGSFGTGVSNTGSDISAETASITTASNLSMIAGFTANGDGVASAGAPATSRLINNATTSFGNGCMAMATAQGTGSPESWAWADSVAEAWGTLAVEILPPSSGNTSSGSLGMRRMNFGATSAETENVTGSLAMRRMALHATATETETSSGSLAMKRMNMSATVSLAVTVTATGSLAMKRMAFGAAATETETSSGNLTMRRMNMSGTAAVASGSLQMRRMQMSATATEIFNATGSLAKRRKNFGVTGLETEPSTGNLTMRRMNMSGTVSVSTLSSGSLAMRRMQMLGLAGNIVNGTGNLQMRRLAEHATGSELQTFSASLAIRRKNFGGSATEIETLSASLAMRPMRIAGVATEIFTVSGHLSMRRMQQSGLGSTQTVHSTGSLVLRPFRLLGNGTVIVFIQQNNIDLTALVTGRVSAMIAVANRADLDTVVAGLIDAGITVVTARIGMDIDIPDRSNLEMELV